MRNKEIDFIRGLAIVIMVAANSAPALLEGSNTNIYFRFVGSLAAPLFIFLSGVTFRINAEKKKSDLLQNGIILILSAAMVDIFIWGIVPFSTFDVLYLIGISQVVYYFLHNLSLFINVAIVAIGFIVFSLLKGIIAYRFEISDVSILDLSYTNENAIFSLSNIQRLLFDGWFPLLPWMFLFGLGYLIQFNLLRHIFSKIWFLLSGVFLFLIGILFMMINHSIQEFRDGYIELFYPVNSEFLLVIFGWLGIVLGISRFFLKGAVIGRFLAFLGEKSLFVYILHLVVISYLFSLCPQVSFSQFLLVSLLFVLSIGVVLWFVETKKMKELRGRLPKVLRKLLGI